MVEMEVMIMTVQGGFGFNWVVKDVILFKLKMIFRKVVLPGAIWKALCLMMGMSRWCTIATCGVEYCGVVGVLPD